jgi:N-acetylmuramoyl-L-alanine amidase
MTLRLGAMLLVISALASAGPLAAEMPRSRILYERALQRERELRVAEPPPTLQQLRNAVNAYDALVRKFPVSGYSDNALWQGGNLSLLAYERFGQPADTLKAASLLRRLQTQYPTSSLAARVDEALGEVPNPVLRADQPLQSRPLPHDLSPEATAVGRPASAEGAAVRRSLGEGGSRAKAERPATVDGRGLQASADGGRNRRHALAAEGRTHASAGPAQIRGIKRMPLPDGMRVTLELDAEVAFRSERLENPRRVFFDLKGTRPVPALQDATLRFTDDLVREVRLGRHPQNTTRVVFDMEGIDSYSVFTLYNPFRLLIDFKASGSLAVPELAPIATAARPEPVPLALVASLHVPPQTPPVVAKPLSDRPLDPPSRPLASRPVVLASPIPPALPSANSDGKFSLARQLGLGVSRIVIDAGHGGHDPGAHANGISESELVLDVALRLNRLMEKQLGIEVVMTRDTDVFIPLEERTAIANREGADLFLSIHANASRNPRAHGVETYFLNFASNPEAEAVAARENSSSARAMHSLPDIVRAIALNNKIDESRDFAEMVQRSMVRRLAARNKQLKDLGVKQAPFVVLIGAAMPSVLAEVSFVTNKQEGQLLKTGAYRQQIAEALLDAVLRYQQSLKKLPVGAAGNGAR